METLALKAVYLAKGIDLDTVTKELHETEVLRMRTRVIHMTQERHYIFCTSFGVVVFLGITVDEELRVLRAIRPALREPVTDGWSDTHTIVVDTSAAQDEVTFDRVRIHELTVDHVDLICRALAQSVAIAQFDADADRIVAEFQRVFSGLRTHGRLQMRTRPLLRVIGASDEILRTVIAELALLHVPRRVWEDAHLETLWTTLHASLDIEPRFERLRFKLDYLRQSTEQLLSICNERRATQLELVIIGLFVFEVLVVAYEFVEKVIAQ